MVVFSQPKRLDNRALNHTFNPQIVIPPPKNTIPVGFGHK